MEKPHEGSPANPPQEAAPDDVEIPRDHEDQLECQGAHNPIPEVETGNVAEVPPAPKDSHPEITFESTATESQKNSPGPTHEPEEGVIGKEPVSPHQLQDVCGMVEVRSRWIK